MKNNSTILEKIQIPFGERLIVSHAAYEEGEAHLCGRHFHELHELILFETVSGHFGCDEGVRELVDRSVVFIPSMHPHDFELSLAAKKWYILQFPSVLIEPFKFSDPNDLFDTPSVFQPDQVTFDRMIYLAKWLNSRNAPAKHGRAAPTLDCDIGEEILALLIKLIANTNDRKSDADFGFARSMMTPFLQEISGLNGRLNLTMPEAAKLCAQSSSTFARKFKTVFGMSYTDFMIQNRLQRACYELSFTNNPITQIAYALEFASPSYFCLRFRKRYGVSPKVYREETRRSYKSKFSDGML